MKLYTNQEKKLYNYLDNIKAIEKDISDILFNDYCYKAEPVEERYDKLVHNFCVLYEDLYGFNMEIRPIMRALDKSIIRKEMSNYHEESTKKSD